MGAACIGSSAANPPEDREQSSASGASMSTSRPESYASFVSVGQHASLEEAIAKERYVWLPAGDYVIDNPLVIRRDEPLFIHGGDRSHTRILGADPSKPLIVIEKAPLVNFTSVMLRPGKVATPNAQALVVKNRTPTVVELQDCRVSEGGVELLGPGSFRFQNTLVRPQGLVRNGVLVDHPDALFDVVGGDMSNLRGTPRVPTDEAYHIRVKRGRLRIYSMSIQAAIGPADFRIDSASRHGPHVLTAVRSEGNNGANKGSYRYGMIQVPPTDEPVDLLLKSNIGAWGSGGFGKGLFLDYNATGTVWMLGNNVQKGAATLAEGKAPGATLVAVGNFTFDDVDPVQVKGARTIVSTNVYYHSLREKTRAGKNAAAQEKIRKDRPLKRFVAKETKSTGALPPIPDDVIPEPLVRPVVNRALPGMRSASEFGAKGDGRSDDTAALQKLLDAGCDRRVGAQVFLPAGTYRITKTLHYNSLTSCKHGTAGFIAGPGRKRTRILRDPKTPGGVFQTHSMSGATVQGISFESAPWKKNAAKPTTESVFALGGGRDAGPATHFVSFYDVGFHGAKYGLGVRLIREGGNGEGNMIINSEFTNSHVGLGIGAFNVLNNNVFDSHFENVDIMIGHGKEGRAGGIWSVFGATGSKIGESMMAPRAGAAGAWYAYGLDAAAPSILPYHSSGGSFPVIFDRSVLRPAGKGPLHFDFGQSGGPIFLHSRVSGLHLSLRGKNRSMFAIRIGGEVDAWKKAESRGRHGRVIEFAE
jgi:hypothetical protein